MKKIIVFIVLFKIIFAFNIFQNEYYFNSIKMEKIKNYDNAIKDMFFIYKNFYNKLSKKQKYFINMRIAYLFYLNKNYINSIFYYKKSLNIFPYSFEPRYGLINNYLVIQNYKDALKLCNGIIKKDFYNYKGNLYLIFIYNKLNDKKKVYSIKKKMSELYPLDINFY